MNRNEDLWAGQFGDDYHKRNAPSDRRKLWSDVFGLWEKPVPGCVIKSVCEVGAGLGDNLDALKFLMGSTLNVGIEVNSKACQVLTERGFVAVNAPFLEVNALGKFDLVVTRGFLMHVPDADVEKTLRKLYESTNLYLCVAEYFSPVRRQVHYHGQDDALWLDDFAGRLLEMYPDLKLIRYGFQYHRDCGGNDVTYFLLKKGA